MILSLPATASGMSRTTGPWSDPSDAGDRPGARCGRSRTAHGTSGELSRKESSRCPALVGRLSSSAATSALRNPHCSHSAWNLLVVGSSGDSGHTLKSPPRSTGFVPPALLAAAYMATSAQKDALDA